MSVLGLVKLFPPCALETFIVERVRRRGVSGSGPRRNDIVRRRTRAQTRGTMSTIYFAGQFDSTTLRQGRNNNWEVPADGRAKHACAKPKGVSHRTSFIADDRGYILQGHPKHLTSFSTGFEMNTATERKRWPNSALTKRAGSVTVGPPTHREHA